MMTIEEFGRYALSIAETLEITASKEGGLKLSYTDGAETDFVYLHYNSSIEHVKQFVSNKELERLQRRGNFSIEEMRAFFMEEFNCEQ